MTGKKKKTLAAITLVALILAVVTYLFAFGPFSHRPHFRPFPVVKVDSRPVTITGEVVDTWCYASQTMGIGRGPGHKPCGLGCALGGVTLGILEDGTEKLYIAAKSSQPYKGCQDLLAPLMAEHVVVNGWLAERGGCRILKIKSVEKVSASSQK